jgi:hypothetical protein
MMTFKCDLWHWVSYDQYQKEPKNKMLIIEVTPEKRYQDDLEVRLRKAEKMVAKLIEMRSNDYQGKIKLIDLL